jgi:hypothetical protein
MVHVHIRMLMRILAGFALVAAVSGCSMEPVNLNQIKLNFPQPLVAKKDPTPLFIVASDKDVPDHFTTPADPVKPVEIFAVRTFVTRDVQQALEAFYQTVKVVSNESDLPSTPHIAAKVRITNITTQADMATGNGVTAGRVFGAMDWAIALRHSGEDKFFYSFADRAIGTTSLTNVAQTGIMFGSTLEVALGRFLKDFSDKVTSAKN